MAIWKGVLQPDPYPLDGVLINQLKHLQGEGAHILFELTERTTLGCWIKLEGKALVGCESQEAQQKVLQETDVSKKSPRGFAERTPKKAEYLIARSHFTLGVRW